MQLTASKKRHDAPYLKDLILTAGSHDFKIETKESVDLEFLKRRTLPDVILIDRHNHIVFMSRTGDSISKLLESTVRTTTEREAGIRLRQALSQLRTAVLAHDQIAEMEQCGVPPTALFSFQEMTVSLRGLLLKGTGLQDSLVMILIEKINRDEREAQPSNPLPHFTPREKAVLSYVKKGFTNKEIACVLDIGVHTVKDHVKQIMHKVNVHTRSGIAGRLAGKRPFSEPPGNAASGNESGIIPI